MSLKVQMFSILFSFVFGIACMLSFKVLSKYLLYIKLKYKIIFNIMFFSFLALIYFLLLRMINNGILHSYFFLFFIFGIFVVKKIVK